MQNWIFDIRSRAFLLLCISFLIVTFLVYLKTTEIFDSSVMGFFHTVSGNAILDLFMESVTEIGDVFYLLVFTIVLLILKRTRRIGISLIISLVLVTILTGYIKCGVDRERPELDFLGVDFPLKMSKDTFALFCEGGYLASYPSGHVARAAVFAVILGYSLSQRYPRGSYLLLLFPALMSISRMYVMAHFPMDVIGGAILGVFIAGTLAKKTKLNLLFKNQ